VANGGERAVSNQEEAAEITSNQPISQFSPASSAPFASRRKTARAGPALQLGLGYARGLREEAARALLQARGQRAFRGIDDLARRVPELRKNELALLAEIGALNEIAGGERQEPAEAENGGNGKRHRRDALWQVARATRRAGPLLEGIAGQDAPSPLAPMNGEERLAADFQGTGLTVGPHLMAYRRREMDRRGVRRAADLPHLPTGKRVRAAGAVIARQRPGTAQGFAFLSLEDETGIANVIVAPALVAQHRRLLASGQFLFIEGILQNLDHVVSIKAERILPL
jgi:error-prone DNA polymerase